MRKLSWTVKSFLLSVLIPVAVIVLSVPIGIYCLPCEQRLPFFIGVFASVIASCIFLCFTIYSDIRKTICEIAKIEKNFESYYNIYGASDLNTPDHIFALKQMHNQMNYTSSTLPFSSDFKKLTKTIYDVIEAIKKCEFEEADKKMNNLIKIAQDTLR